MTKIRIRLHNYGHTDRDRLLGPFLATEYLGVEWGVLRQGDQHIAIAIQNRGNDNGLYWHTMGSSKRWSDIVFEYFEETECLNPKSTEDVIHLGVTTSRYASIVPTKESTTTKPESVKSPSAPAVATGTARTKPPVYKDRPPIWKQVINFMLSGIPACNVKLP